MNEGMVGVGERFSSGEYFLSQLIFSAEIFKNVLNMLEPFLPQSGTGGTAGKVVIGTVKGDIHDIGKNIVVSLLKRRRF
ncbi:MAG: cobalamin B12-binding domain-containing protein [Desulfotomaculales bacterium]